MFGLSTGRKGRRGESFDVRRNREWVILPRIWSLDEERFGVRALGDVIGFGTSDILGVLAWCDADIRSSRVLKTSI